jgi:hypothetical protein
MKIAMYSRVALRETLMDVFVYLGTLAAIIVVALILIVIVTSRRSRGKPSPSHTRSPARSLPLVQVALGKEDGELLWAIDGRVTRDLASVTGPAERLAVAELIERVREVHLPALSPQNGALLAPPAFAETPRSGEPRAEAVAQTVRGAAGAMETHLPPSTASRPEDELDRPFLGRLRESVFGVDYAPGPARALFAPPPSVAPRRGKKKVEVPEPTYGIPRFEELSALVQEKLAGEPDAPPASIRVGHDGMLEIVVDGRIYGHINDVPDETARRAIQSAVESWNRQV